MVRLKNRYIIAQAVNSYGKNYEIGSNDIQTSLREKIRELFGDIGFGEYGNNTYVRFFDPKSKIFVVRTTRDGESNTHLSMSCVTKVKELSFVLRSLNVKSCTRTCIATLQNILLIYYNNFNPDNVEENKIFIESLVNSIEL
jgi:RNase P/RNase MRP subunit POP5